MKKVMRLYESCKTSIKVAFFGFVLISIGYLIQSPNVNLFYTFKSSFILFIGEFFIRIGEIITMNLPIIFMLNGVCKKAHNSSPVVMALVGYFAYIVTTMMFSVQNLDAQAYATGYGINSIFNISSGTRVPLETGMIGALLVAIATRFAFVLSRHRGAYSITNVLSKDVAGVVYNALFCFAAGVVVSYGYPIIYTYVQKLILFISEDLSDPFRISIFSVADRVLTMFGLGNIIKYPFWFTSYGGSLQNTATGKSILGDVNLWTYTSNNITNYVGAGRFITPYYVINMFIIPGILLGTYLTISDKKAKSEAFLALAVGAVMSFICGNPLAFEILMFTTSPLLLAFYFVVIGLSSYLLVSLGAFLGYSTSVTNTYVAMPGNFPDFIINLRNTNLSHTLLIIFLIGVGAFIICTLLTIVYYRYFAFDFANTGKGDALVGEIIDSLGGKDNIIVAGSSLFKLDVYIRNPEAINIEKIKEIGPRRVQETRDGINFEFGTSSYAIAKRINKAIS